MSAALANERQVVQAHVRELLQQIHELELTLTEGPANIQAVVAERLSEYARGLQALHDLAPQLPADRVPVDLLSYMDAGGNPDVYTESLFRACIRDNELTKGKVQAMEQLEASLLAKAASVFPDVTSKHLSWVAAASAADAAAATDAAAKHER